MSLSDLKNKLYKKETDSDLSKHAESEFDIRFSPKDSGREKFTASDAWGEEKPSLGVEEKKAARYGVIALGVILLVVVVLLGVYKYKQYSFSPERATLTINGPSEIQSGKTMTYEIVYKNDNRASLKDTVLHLSFPDNFKPEDNPSFSADGANSYKLALGEIKKYDQGKITFRGKVFSPKGSLIYLKAELSYQPSGFSSQFVSQQQLSINVISFPVILELQAPQNLASGDSLNYLISYKNTSSDDFENMRLQVEYPEGFIFSKADPGVSENDNIWYFGHLSAGQAGKITISGKLEGASEDVKVLKADIGTLEEARFVSYNKENVSTKIEASPFFITQTVNGLKKLTAKSGDTLRFEISYRNDGNIGLRNAIVTEKIDSPALDYASLNLNEGSFNSFNNTITWKASDFKKLANLEPGSGDKIGFSIKVKDNLPNKTAADKNFVISSVAKIDSPDIVTPIMENKIIAGNTIDIKVNTKIGLAVRGYYGDPVIKNSGPIPPEVDKETSYSIHWLVMNTSNDAEKAKVEAVLPTGVIMTGVKYPEDSNLTYNERTNAVVWDIGNLPAGTGIRTPPREAVFQIKIKPAPNQVDTQVNLVGISIFSIHDAFTGEDFSVTGEAKSTQLREDPAAGNDYKVKPAT